MSSSLRVGRAAMAVARRLTYTRACAALPSGMHMQPQHTRGLAGSAKKNKAEKAKDKPAAKKGKGKEVSKKTSTKGASKGKEDAQFEMMLRVLRGQVPDAEPFTEEQQKRFQEIGRRYNSMTSRKHNHLMHDLQTKIDMKWEAINALPAELQAEAVELDDAPMPPERGIPTWTPPIPGFYLPGEEAQKEEE